MSTPIVLDLGSISPKGLKRLKRGTGKKMPEVDQACQQAKQSAGPNAPPVVVLYRKKRKRRRTRLPLPFPFAS